MVVCPSRIDTGPGGSDAGAFDGPGAAMAVPLDGVTADADGPSALLPTCGLVNSESGRSAMPDGKVSAILYKGPEDVEKATARDESLTNEEAVGEGGGEREARTERTPVAVQAGPGGIMKTGTEGEVGDET